MERKSSLPRAVWLAIGCALIGWFAGMTVGASVVEPRLRTEPATRALSPPHHVPKTPDGMTLRFAMVQDILTERYARHGEAYYRARNEHARAQLAKVSPDSDEADALSDDLGAGLDLLGRHDEAAKVLRAKLARQEARRIPFEKRYTSFANLGTALIHGHTEAALAGDPGAKERLREGLNYIYAAIKVNPNAHFGREVWQAVAVEWLLACVDQPELLERFDMIGNRLEAVPRPGRARAYDPGWLEGPGRWAATGSGSSNSARQYITQVGAELGWDGVPVPSLPKPVPFDEPVLGIVGMWREGGRADPHFALCLGETMIRVGQRYLAWNAFERAARMADRFWPDPERQRQLTEYCRERQTVLQATMSPDEVKDLRPRFEAELAHGQRYQKEYQDHEARQLAAGKSIDDPNLNAEFHAARQPIASAVGMEEQIMVAEGDRYWDRKVPYTLSFGALGAAFGLFVAALLARRLGGGGGPEP